MQADVVLDQFEGPIDLLVQLVRRGEIEAAQVCLQQITTQLLSLYEGEETEVDAGAEMLTPAANLLLLKSRSLLPIEEGDNEPSIDSGTPEELRQHVVEYCRARQAAAELASREREHAGRYAREAKEPQASGPQGSGVHHMGLPDLVEIVEAALRRAKATPIQVIEEEKWRVSDAITTLRSDLGKGEPIPFEHYFNPERDREQMIVFFLAILELMKLQELRVDRGAITAV